MISEDNSMLLCVVYKTGHFDQTLTISFTENLQVDQFLTKVCVKCNADLKDID